MSDLPYLSIVLPAYNEAERLPPTLEKMFNFFADFKQALEVLIVVERSTDGTLEIARRLVESHSNFQVIDNAVQRGKGHAVRSGMLRSRGGIVFYMDVDLSVPLPEIHRFLEYFKARPEIDVVVGNRQHAQSRITLAQSWLRQTMG